MPLPLNETKMKKKLFSALACACVAAFICVPALADDDAKPKHTIKQVMKEAFKGKAPLVKKVASGDASEEEAKKLHELLVSLSKNKPKKGEAENWTKLTTALVKASQGVVDGKDGAAAQLGKAANCKTCHGDHK